MRIHARVYMYNAINEPIKRRFIKRFFPEFISACTQSYGEAVDHADPVARQGGYTAIHSWSAIWLSNW